MADEKKIEDVTTDDTTADVQVPETKVEAKVEAPDTKVEDAKNIDNAVFAALRKRDIEGAKKLLEADKPAEVDMTGFVEKGKFDELLEKFGELKETYDTSSYEAERDKVISKYNLTEEDASLIMTKDLKEFEERAEKLSGRNNVVARRAAVKTEIPADLKDNDLADRLLS